MGESLQSYLQTILEGLCDPTLQMISADSQNYPEFRAGFFKLIQNIIKHCTEGYFSLDAGKFGTVIDTVLFAMSHVKPELMEIGLEAMQALLQILSNEPRVASVFYQRYYCQILNSTLNVMTDYQHMSGFKLQGLIMQQLI